MELDKTKDYAEIGGAGALKYMQNGHGFDNKGNYLGRFGKGGVPLAEEAAPTPPPAPDPIPEPEPEPVVEQPLDEAAVGQELEPETDPAPERARDDEGQFKADDPATPEVNEAYVGGKAPKAKAKAKKAKG